MMMFEGADRGRSDMRSIACAAVFFILALMTFPGTGKVRAAPEAAASADSAETDDEEKVAMPTLVVPVMRGGRLWGQAFVSIELAAPSEIWKVRAKVHALQDALVRAAYGRPLDLPPDMALPTDGPAAKAAVAPILPFLADAARQAMNNDLVEAVMAAEVIFRPL